MNAAVTLPRIMVCVCTYQRNDLLRKLLTRFVEIRDAGHDRYRLGVVVVDDNKNGEARIVVDQFDGEFPLGFVYRRAGFNNISICRNLALEGAIGHADALAMTDDDCMPDVDWVAELVDMWKQTGATAVSGSLRHVLADGAPEWLTEQSIFDFAASPGEHGATLDTAQTNNCLIDLAWLESHPNHRFDERFGRIGGEDMVFFRGAIRLGLRSVHSATARVTQYEPLSELSFATVTRLSFWLGNSEAVTNLELGDASRGRLVMRGGRRLFRAAARPVRRLFGSEPPHLRYWVVQSAGALGVVAGAIGVRANHH